MEITITDEPIFQEIVDHYLERQTLDEWVYLELKRLMSFMDAECDRDRERVEQIVTTALLLILWLYFRGDDDFFDGDGKDVGAYDSTPEFVRESLISVL